MASAATGGYGVHLQLADECAAVHGLHDGGFRHCMRLKVQEPDSSSALQLVAGPLPRRRTAVLIVDEAQNLSDEVLEEIRLMTNLETFTEKLLQIVLVG